MENIKDIAPSSPLVSVLMPVYNGERFLRDAIDSILSQSYTHIEFIIINDGSTDSSKDIILQYQDPRIRYIENEENIKLIASLNKGIQLAAGKYIARMDADDVSLPERLSKQVAFMESNPAVAACGSYTRTLDLEANYDIHYETEHDFIKFRLFFDTHFPHPAAIIRKSVLDTYGLQFDMRYKHAEDFMLWNEIARHAQLANIPEILLLKRSHEQQISVVHEAYQQTISRQIRKRLIETLEMDVSEHEMDLYERCIAEKYPETESDVYLLLGFIERLITANKNTGTYKESLFNAYFSKKYWLTAANSTHLGLPVFKKYLNSITYRKIPLSDWQIVKFFIKSVLKKHRK